MEKKKGMVLVIFNKLFKLVQISPEFLSEVEDRILFAKYREVINDWAANGYESMYKKGTKFCCDDLREFHIGVGFGWILKGDEFNKEKFNKSEMIKGYRKRNLDPAKVLDYVNYSLITHKVPPEIMDYLDRKELELFFKEVVSGRLDLSGQSRIGHMYVDVDEDKLIRLVHSFMGNLTQGKVK